MAQTQASKDKQAAARAAIKAELMEEMKADQDKAIQEAVEAERARVAAATATTVEGQLAAESTLPEVDPLEDDVHTVHILEDGFTLLGAVRYRGDEIIIRRDSPEWKELIDPTTGKNILELEPREQYRRWGKQCYAPGLWPLDPYDVDDPNLTDAEREKLRTIQEEREARARKLAGRK